MGLMHQNMHIVYSELNRSVQLFDIVTQFHAYFNDLLISVALYHLFCQIDKRMCVIDYIHCSVYLYLNHKSASVIITMKDMSKWMTVTIFCAIFCTQGSAVSRQSLLYEYIFGACASSRVPAVYNKKMWLSVTFVCQCTVTEFLVKEKQLKCSDLCVCIDATSIRKWVTWNRDVFEEPYMNVSKHGACCK